MIVLVVLIVLGLCIGSFINAFVWRLHLKLENSKDSKKLSIVKGRSVCPNCRHKLSVLELIPLLSWFVLGGRCRYCNKPISPQYPIVEAITALLFVLSYQYWFYGLFTYLDTAAFVIWLLIVTILIALSVYDLRWYILPNVLVYPLLVLSVTELIVIGIFIHHLGGHIAAGFLGALAAGGVAYILYAVSDGKWIGGGDVKILAAIGLILANLGELILVILLSSLVGSAISLILIASKKLSRKSVIPFGPFLMASTFISAIWGPIIIWWYLTLFWKV